LLASSLTIRWLWRLVLFLLIGILRVIVLLYCRWSKLFAKALSTGHAQGLSTTARRLIALFFFVVYFFFGRRIVVLESSLDIRL
jgi:hypothetical protein